MKKVVVYSSPQCHDCHSLKDFLFARGVPFTEKNVAEDMSARKELMEKYGRMATPTIVVGEKVFLGFRENRQEIEKLLDTPAGGSDD
jgi:glutaredoxin-like YruB-family protein